MILETTQGIVGPTKFLTSMAPCPLPPFSCWVLINNTSCACDPGIKKDAGAFHCTNKGCSLATAKIRENCTRYKKTSKIPYDYRMRIKV